MHSATHHISNGQLPNGNGVLTIQSNGDHVNNHGFYEKSPIINSYGEKRNGTNSNHLQQTSSQVPQQQNPMPQATNSRRRTISSNSNGYDESFIFNHFQFN